jgi:hypothetical protein
METFLNETQLSEMLQVSLACLRRWRLRGEGQSTRRWAHLCGIALKRSCNGWTGCRRAETVGDRSPSAHPPSGCSLRLKALVPGNWITTVHGTLRDRNGSQVLFVDGGSEGPSGNGMNPQR